MPINTRHYSSWLLIVLLLVVWAGCLPVRSVFLAGPDYKDSKRLKNTDLHASDRPFVFETTDQDWGKLLKVDDWTTDVPVFNTVEYVAKEHDALAFLIIRHDTVLMEYYDDKYTATDRHPSYSVAKSFTSALVGIAMQEGYINSIDDKVKQYLPELDFDPYFDQLSIRHLLDHTSGFKYSLSVDAHIYYGKNVWNGVNQLKFDTIPGTKQSYLNMNTQLLGLLLQRVTGKTLDKYLQDKIWTPLGMQTDAFWSTDGKGNVRSFCCLNATALDYAKLGRLYMHKGNWEGKQIVNEAWVNETLSVDTTQGSSLGYHHSWYVGLEKYNDFMAIGYYKQHIYVNPEKDLVIVLLGTKENKLRASRVNWWFIFRQLADQL